MTRIVRSLSVFCESFSKCTFSFSYVLFLTSFAFYHINKVRRFARHLLFDFSYFPSVVNCHCISSKFKFGSRYFSCIKYWPRRRLALLVEILANKFALLS